MQVTDLPIEKIIIGERYRKDLGDLSELVDSIKKHGVIQPITIDRGFKLLAGERRLTASKAAGLSEIPCIIRESAGELDAREIELVENIQRKDMSWSERAKLEKCIHDLKTKEDPNWTQGQTSDMLGHARPLTNLRLQLAEAIEVIPELGAYKTQDEAWRKLKSLRRDVEVQQRITEARKISSHWFDIADRAYTVGNTLELITKVRSDCIHFAEVDPPYAVALDKIRSDTIDNHRMDEYNEISPEDYPVFLQLIASEVYRVMAPDSFCVWWHGSAWHTTVLETLEAVGFKVSQVPAIWYKGPVGQTAKPEVVLGNSYEPFFVARKGSPRLQKPGRSNVFEFARPSPSERIHPTERPVDLILEIMDTFVMPKSRVLCPFLGSGNTIIAGLHRYHHIIGWDLSDKYKAHYLNRANEELHKIGIEEKTNDQDEAEGDTEGPSAAGAP